MVSVDSNYYYFLGFVNAFCLPIALLAVWYFSQNRMMDLYYVNVTVYCLRFASILISFCIYLVTQRKISAMFYRKGDSSNFPSTARYAPILELSDRLKLYVLVQIVSRLGAAWYEIQYGFTTSSYGTLEDSPLHTASIVTFAFFTPLAGIGFFYAFISKQPSALKTLLHHYPCFAYFFKQPNEVEENKRKSIAASIVTSGVVESVEDGLDMIDANSNIPDMSEDDRGSSVYSRGSETLAAQDKQDYDIYSHGSKDGDEQSKYKFMSEEELYQLLIEQDEVDKNGGHREV